MAVTTALRKLPWQALFQAMFLFRRFIFAREPLDVDYMTVETTDTDDLRRLFLSDGMMKGDYASYYYFGEDLNMVKGMYKDNEYEWYQYHVRGFDTSDGTILRPHTELYWRIYPKKHIKLIDLDVEEGIEMTKDVLDENDVEYDVVRV